MTVLIVGAYILLNGGVIIMGFLGSDWTRNHAINYFSTVLGISLQIFIMQLLVIVGNDLIMGFIDTASEGAADYMGMVVMSILYYALICVVPNMASSLTNGFFTFDSAKAVHSGAGVAAAAAGLSLLAKSGMEVGASKLSQTSIGQKVQDTLSQFTSGSGAIQSASSGAGALLQGADKLTNSALNSMAQQSSIGRAFSQMAKESIPSDGHKTLSKAMGGGASETLSSDDAVKQATSSFQGTSNHDALKSRLQEHRQQPRTNKRV
ncbi:hypothetical protein JCM19232_4988 [Vibrio ishigakensis]|uniref:Uncharacterized protein n=1 Tax=Vibrio ishigakensis TaxID=1481914 RepID=A0A0B8PQS6_9VIBR|nr:hypothetical protein JCM19232_4988 [Vibrio ishigakensis]